MLWLLDVVEHPEFRRLRLRDGFRLILGCGVRKVVLDNDFWKRCRFEGGRTAWSLLWVWTLCRVKLLGRRMLIRCPLLS